MNLKDKIYIAGHLGLVGSSIVRALKDRGFNNLIMRSHIELDLTNQKEVNTFFNIEKPDIVILAAAKVEVFMQIVHIQQISFIKIQ